jgi:hypothetical protein
MLASVPRISFAQGDLEVFGAFTLDKGASFMISFDNARFFNEPTGTVQVQLELFYNSGDFHIRWGDLLPDFTSIAVGIENENRTTPVAIPAALSNPNLFDLDGVTSVGGPGVMPQNKCLAFIVTSPPTSSPTASPTQTS